MRFPWYRWWIGRAWGDQGWKRLSPHARGAFRDLLDASWDVGPLEDPVQDLCAVGWPRAEAELLWAEFRKLWDFESGVGWTHHVLEEERQHAIDRSARGRSAAERRWAPGRRQRSLEERWEELGRQERAQGGA